MCDQQQVMEEQDQLEQTIDDIKLKMASLLTDIDLLLPRDERLAMLNTLANVAGQKYQAIEQENE